MYNISKALIPPKMSEEEKQELSKSIRSYRPVDDVVLYALAIMPGDKFTLSNKKIHNSFHELKKENPKYFSDLLFDTNGLYPYSEQLEEIFFRFGQSGILEWSLSPQYHYFPRSRKRVVLKNLSRKFSYKEKKDMAKISKGLHELVLKD